MRVLLAVTCLVAVFSQDQAFEISPGANLDTFLNEAQTEMIKIYKKLYPDGQRFNSEIANVLVAARNDLCKIKYERYQSDGSIIMGKTCKIEFVKLYLEDPEQCSGVFCEVLTDAETFLNDTMKSLIAAGTEDKFFGIIEEQIINPIMNYSCRCSMRMLGAWMNCKHMIGEASIWDLLLDFGKVNLTAEYLGGQGWKDFWVDVVVNGLPWDDIKKLFGRTMANLCQRNTDSDKRGNAKCYTYFYDAFTELYKVFLRAAGKKLAVKRKARPEETGVPSHCTTYDLSASSEVANITFDAIEDAVVDKFCDEDCAPLYQRALFGCCTASIIQDTALEEALFNTAQRLADLVEEVHLHEDSEEVDEAFKFNITLYLAYYQDVLEMLSDPTCDDTDVSYDMTPCVGGSSDSCAGLQGKQLKICKRRQKNDSTEGSQSEEEETSCDGLKGKQRIRCQKKQKKKAGGKEEGKERGKEGGKGGAEGKASSLSSGPSKYTFHAMETAKIIGGTLYNVTTVNGTIKGPAIHVKNGSILWVNVTNGLKDGGLGLSIHWHGLNMKGVQVFDGVVGLTQCPIALNDSFLYSWTVNEQPGTYWYHTHDRKMFDDSQRDFIKGPLIVHEPDATIPRIMQNSYQWKNEIILFYITIDDGNNIGVVNGEENPLIQVDNGEYRFRIINGGGHHLFFSIGSYKLTVVAADGYSVKPHETDGIQIGIAERYDVTINFDIETPTEDVCIRAQFKEKMEKGLFATLRIRRDGSVPLKKTKPDINQVCSGIPPLADKKILNCYSDTFKCTDVTELNSTLKRNLYNSSVQSHTVKIIMSESTRGVDWKVAIDDDGFRKNEIPCRPAIKKLNSTIERHIGQTANILRLPEKASVTIVLLSNTMEQHPIHLHGHHYEVLEIYAPANASESCTFPHINTAFSEPIEQLMRRPKQGVLKDTVLLPQCGAVAVRFISDNPGVWFFHCHIDYHLHHGLAWILDENNYMFSQTQFPQGYPSCQVCE